MIKIFKFKFVAVAAFIFVLLFAALSLAPKISAKAYSDPYSYEIEKYSVTMDVTKDRTVYVTEEITAFLTGRESHGIIRDIPDEDVYIRNISASCDDDDFYFYVSKEDLDGYTSVYMKGSSVATGETRTYTLTYEYIIPVGEAGEDAISLNIIGYGWTVPLKDVTATFILPAKPLTSKYYSGKVGGSLNEYATVSENFSSGKYTVTLTAELLPLLSYPDVACAAGITGGFTFESGYLGVTDVLKYKVEDFLDINAFTLASVAISASAVVICLVLYSSRKREKTIIPVVTFTPPMGLDPLKIGKYCDGTVDDKDVLSLVYYLAAKGYLTVEVADEKGKKIFLHKTEKGISDDIPPYAVRFYNALFAYENSVNVKKLGEHFYGELSKIKSECEAVKTLPDSSPMYDGSANRKKNVIFTASAFMFVISSLVRLVRLIALRGFNAFMDYPEIALPLAVVFGVGFVCACLIGGVSSKKNPDKKAAVGMFFGGEIVSLAIAAIGGWFFGGGFISYAVSILSVGVCSLLSALCFIRSDKYIDLLGDIEGFKNFILYTEKDRIELMLNDNPELFYDILPYAQVLSVTDEWENKFRSIPISEPSWMVYSYSGYTVGRSINNMIFWHAITGGMNSGYKNYLAEQAAKAAAAAAKGSGGHGGFSGGGGFGGGGGRGC